jgi:V/A-type H+/Na+-transporting ATPase subunit D
MVTQEVKPTRSELLAIQRRISLYERGYKLLKMKRDGLVMEFFTVLGKVKDVRSKITEDYKRAEERLAIATSVDGRNTVQSAAFAIRDDPHIKIGSKNVMGVVVPTTLESGTVKRRIDQRGYGVTGISVRVDEASDSFEQLVEDIILAAEFETTLRRLIDEIEKNKRIVNALEFRIIPELRKQVAFIQARLEEMERENIFRLIRIKGSQV